MIEHPILMSGPMVRAILDGRKSQTRRLVKRQPEDRDQDWKWSGRWLQYRRAGVGWCLDQRCPYGEPGDRLWVRETWRPVSAMHQHWTSVLYAADDTMRDCPYFACRLGDRGWRPSIHIPRSASRITLEISAVRVERLQSISEYDAKAEGSTQPKGHASWRAAFRALWEEMDGAESWAANPLVWVISFKRLTTP